MHLNSYLNKNFPIWRDAEALVIQVELAVRQFPRYHKYTLGTELRQLAMQVLSNVTHAINQKQGAQGKIKSRMQWLARLILVVQELKLKIQIGKTLQAFASFAVFEQLAKLVVAVAKQATAWHNKLQGGTASRGPR
jgi:hypothetical protein